jgi:hypothetical protein
MQSMFYVPKGCQPGINEEKNATTKQQDEQGGTPDQVTECYNVLTESFQTD